MNKKGTSNLTTPKRKSVSKESNKPLQTVFKRLYTTRPESVTPRNVKDSSHQLTPKKSLPASNVL